MLWLVGLHELGCDVLVTGVDEWAWAKEVGGWSEVLGRGLRVCEDL